MPDFARFDTRHYPTLSVREGYRDWTPSYEDTVQDAMDLALLERIESVHWAEAERVAAETKKALQQEYDMQLKELRSQKEQLESQLKAGTNVADGVDADPEVINEEMSRVDAEIDEINQLIEDPNAALSNVMRKNAERSELKAYRRGLSYLAERIATESTES